MNRNKKRTDAVRPQKQHGQNYEGYDRFFHLMFRQLEGKVECAPGIGFPYKFETRYFFRSLVKLLSRPRKETEGVFAARRSMENLVLVLGRVARNINSSALPRIVQLRVDLMRLVFNGTGKASRKEAFRLAREFADCHDFVVTEIEFMDACDRTGIWRTPPIRKPDISGEYELFYPQKGMTPEDATRESRAAALRNHALIMSKHGIPEKIAALSDSLTRLADMAQSGEAPSASECPLDGEALRAVLSEITDFTYIRFYNLDWWLRDENEPDYADEDDDGAEHVWESTDESRAMIALGSEIARYVDAALALAVRIGSSAAKDFSSVKSLFERYGMHYGSSSSDQADLDTFVKKLLSACARLNSDVVAAKLGGDVPVKVELTKKSGETIAKAVRPGRGGARRIFDEATQEKCWLYWENGRRNPKVFQGMDTSGRKVTYADVFAYYRRELAALKPPIESLEAFKAVLRARTNRISRKKSH